MFFSLNISNIKGHNYKNYEIEFSMIGLHNIQNALASIAVGIELDIPITKIKKTLKTFTGIERRFQQVGKFKDTCIIDDYGHHPVEISSALAAARLITPKHKIISIFQPHRYSRLRDLFDDFCSCFNDADHVLLLDVFPAGEEPITNFKSTNLEIVVKKESYEINLKNLIKYFSDIEEYEICTVLNNKLKSLK